MTVFKAGAASGIAALAAVLFLQAAPLQANAFLPVYAAGFDMASGVIAFPAIIFFEWLVLKALLRRDPVPYFTIAPFRVCVRANVFSMLAGVPLVPFGAVYLASLWRDMGGAQTPMILMRQMFVTGYLVTLLVETWAYHRRRPSDRPFWPEKRTWFLSLAANSFSYGAVAWLMAAGALHERDTAPMLWRLAEKLVKP